jgi:hypothetical protein
MKKNSVNLIKMVIFLSIFSSCDYLNNLNDRAREINSYERSALNLAKENRYLKRKMIDLKNDIQSLKAEISFLKLKKSEHDSTIKKRSLASAAVAEEDDLVKQDVYKWPPEKIILVAEKDFEEKNFESAAQFFNAFLMSYPKSPLVSDILLFQAGLSAFESKDKHGWVIKYLGRLIDEYPESKFYRGAKLWKGLAHLKLGDKKSFFLTVEEFRKKYRNTPEWKILSARYETLIQKYK